ncbi:hypothetical protein KSP40_PGU015835 [Platanthera guangdongensis]|uniref:Uncharacterized protein n=1 Tax=Platanthera guangdongensis TaxID=2320717 RepID=A0ABR2M5P3_9ASPA
MSAVLLRERVLFLSNWRAQTLTPKIFYIKFAFFETFLALEEIQVEHEKTTMHRFEQWSRSPLMSYHFTEKRSLRIAMSFHHSLLGFWDVHLSLPTLHCLHRKVTRLTSSMLEYTVNERHKAF